MCITEITCDEGCCKLQIGPHTPFDMTWIKHKKLLFPKKAGVFIYDSFQNSVLLVQSRGLKWGIPKGSANPNEDAISTAIRELYEETGITVGKGALRSSRVLTVSNTKYFMHEMPMCDVAIQTQIENNDANGIAWIKLDCLKKFVKKNIINLNHQTRTVLRLLNFD